MPVRRFELRSPEGGADGFGMYLGEAGQSGAASGLAPEALTRPRSKSWRWLIVGLTSCAALGGVAASALLWMLMLPPAPDCKTGSPLAPDMERLFCAQQAARSGELTELLSGLALIETWTPEHPLYKEAQRSVEEWSKGLLIIARQKMNASDLQGAVEIAQRIPKSSSVRADAEAAIATWQGIWRQGEALVAAAQAAMKEQAWGNASEVIRDLGEMSHPYWGNQRARALSEQLLVERKARQQFAEAQKIAQAGKLPDLAKAIAQAGRIDKSSYAWSDAQPVLNQWSDRLLGAAFQLWQEQKFDQAIALTKQVEVNPGRAEMAKDLIQLSEARKLAVSTWTNWVATPQHVISLMEAIAAAKQIKPTSAYYAQAQSSLASWQIQLDGLRQLQLAQMTAGVGTVETLKTAIAQASKVQPGNPRRLQAQTMIAHWHREIERLEDRPLLARARRLATEGTVASLQSAIAQAGQISEGRALRGEAQALMRDWTRQIQVIEDQPYLNLSRTLARRGRLREAIAAAALVRPNRALYPQARAAIRDWQAELNRFNASPMLPERPIPSPSPALETPFGSSRSGAIAPGPDASSEETKEPKYRLPQTPTRSTPGQPAPSGTLPRPSVPAPIAPESSATPQPESTPKDISGLAEPEAPQIMPPAPPAPPAPPVNVAPPRVVEPPPRVVEPPPRFERPQAAPVREAPPEAAPVRRERPAAMESVPVSPPSEPGPQAMEPESANFTESQS
ncbi:hypothetical protein HNI00_20125 [Thermoleptolyngbya oregonensis NK1-22]|uniref:Chromosome segregation ATPase n=1 Tax=Thermoleptolyngbya oregonensis NK1-22 TaxID=2547457 RepID=A0AA96YRS0_9CYAN|nr:hypothetical protein [Thermoleptolyngbya oregonensis]WOB45187.1 hypothetical protein HNI00_20125 [Thermoleptolyngbya oregonensis NK1-22]